MCGVKRILKSITFTFAFSPTMQDPSCVFGPGGFPATGGIRGSSLTARIKKIERSVSQAAALDAPRGGGGDDGRGGGGSGGKT